MWPAVGILDLEAAAGTIRLQIAARIRRDWNRVHRLTPPLFPRCPASVSWLESSDARTHSQMLERASTRARRRSTFAGNALDLCRRLRQTATSLQLATSSTLALALTQLRAAVRLLFFVPQEDSLRNLSSVLYYVRAGCAKLGDESGELPMAQFVGRSRSRSRLLGPYPVGSVDIGNWPAVRRYRRMSSGARLRLRIAG